MKSSLWGPPLWQAMFACAWHSDARELLLDQLPLLLPCSLCRNHFRSKRTVIDRKVRYDTKRLPRAPTQTFLWLWYLKGEVNRLPPARPNLSYDELESRYMLHGPLVDEVALADVFVLIALDAHARNHDELFALVCTELHKALPVPNDSQFRLALAHVRAGAIVSGALRAARAARVERGLCTHGIAHYKALLA